MKRVLLLLVALFMCGVAVSQEKEKKFTLIIQENLLPFGDDYYVYDDIDDHNDIDERSGRYGCNLTYLNYLPTIELDYDNKFSARLRFNVLKAEEGGGPLDPNINSVLPPFRLNYFNHEIATSTSLTLGYNFLNKTKAHRLKASAIFGAVYYYKDYYWGRVYDVNDVTASPTMYFLPTEKSWHFQVGAELSYQYFLPCTNYRLGLGASCEFSLANYNADPTITMFNLNVSYKLFNF